MLKLSKNKKLLKISAELRKKTKNTELEPLIKEVLDNLFKLKGYYDVVHSFLEGENDV